MTAMRARKRRRYAALRETVVVTLRWVAADEKTERALRQIFRRDPATLFRSYLKIRRAEREALRT